MKQATSGIITNIWEESAKLADSEFLQVAPEWAQDAIIEAVDDYQGNDLEPIVWTEAKAAHHLAAIRYAHRIVRKCQADLNFADRNSITVGEIKRPSRKRRKIHNADKLHTEDVAKSHKDKSRR